jgi:hypothetical protein
MLFDFEDGLWYDKDWAILTVEPRDEADLCLRRMLCSRVM